MSHLEIALLTPSLISPHLFILIKQHLTPFTKTGSFSHLILIESSSTIYAYSCPQVNLSSFFQITVYLCKTHQVIVLGGVNRSTCPRKHFALYLRSIDCSVYVCSQMYTSHPQICGGLHFFFPVKHWSFYCCLHRPPSSTLAITAFPQIAFSRSSPISS